MQQTFLDRPTWSVRGASRGDVRAVAAIDRESHRYAWSRSKFDAAARQPGSVFLVAEAGAAVIGYLLCRLTAHCVRVVRLAVAEEHRRHGVARDLLDFRVIDADRRVLLNVRDDNVAAHLFLRAVGFRAVNVFRGIDAVERVEWYRFVRNPTGGGEFLAPAAPKPLAKRA